jgi:hypothetical protein
MHNRVKQAAPLAAARLSGTGNRAERPRQELVRAPAEKPLRLPPKESGAALMGVGIVGVVLLDPFDIFFLVAGALTFTPRLFRRTERWVQVRFPRFHREGRRHIDVFLDNFEKRYPPGRD